MKRDIEWLKEAIGELDLVDTEFEADGMCYIGTVVRIMQVYDLIDQLDKPEVLPQEWMDKKRLIERVENYIPLHDKTVGDVMHGILEIIKQLPELEVLSPDWIDENQHPYGGDYHVPSEKLQSLLVPKQELPVIPRYYVDLNEAAYVVKWDGDNQVNIYTHDIFGSDEFEFHLTEQEIKSYDERFWPFAVKVEEDK